MKLTKLIDTISSFTGFNFNYGEQIELSLNGDQVYPLLYLEEPILGNLSTLGRYSFEFAVVFLNKQSEIYKENTPILDEYISVLTDFKEHLEKVYTINNLGFVTLRDYSSDSLTGIRIELNLTDNSRC